MTKFFPTVPIMLLVFNLLYVWYEYFSYFSWLMSLLLLYSMFLYVMLMITLGKICKGNNIKCQKI